MIKLLIIADDFTGALDTGIQFVKKGIETQVIIGTQLNQPSISATAQVLVVDSETRPMTGREAYSVIRQIVRQAVEMGIEVIYKKTDSALRGNPGSELSGVLDGASGGRLYFLPAFPDINRITEKGIHYIDGVKLEDSEFGRDPFEPVTCSCIPEILAMQTDKRIVCVERGQEIPAAGRMPEIVVLDASENEDVWQRAVQLSRNGELKLLAGCAGFAAFLPEVMGLTGSYREEIFRTECFLVTCGSLNPITRQQVEYAEKHGFSRVSLLPQQKLCPDYYDQETGAAFLGRLEALCRKERRLELDSFDQEGQESTMEYAARNGIDSEAVRFTISRCYGRLVKQLTMRGLDSTVLMTGGDTLMGLMKELGVNQLCPVAEVGQGTVLSRLYWNGRVLQVISKSGGYGELDVFVRAADQTQKYLVQQDDMAG